MRLRMICDQDIKKMLDIQVLKDDLDSRFDMVVEASIIRKQGYERPATRASSFEVIVPHADAEIAYLRSKSELFRYQKS